MAPDSILQKTELGRQEIATRQLRLDPRSRAVLVVIDGRRTLADLAESLASMGDVAAIVEKLAGLGLVADSRPGAAAARPASPAIAPAPQLSGAEKLAVARREAARALYDALGPDSDPFTARLEQATTVAALLQEAQRAAELLRAVGGRSRADAFLARLLEQLR